MAVRKYKPTTPGRRGASVSTFDEVTRATPEKSLLQKQHSKAGRNVHGRITTRHQGGGTKQRYRVIDFKRNKDGVPAKVAHIEYDPNRSARIALLHYADGEKRYILAPQGVKQGDTIMMRARCRDPSGQRAAAAQHPGRHRDPRDRDEAGRGRQDGAFGRHQRPADGQGGRHGDPAPALAARCAWSRPPARRTVGVVGNAEHELISLGKAGPRPLEEQAPVGPRRRDEPRRPPAGRRRGQVLGWPSPARPGARRKAAHARRTRRRTSTSFAVAGRGGARCRGRQEGSVRRRAPDGEGRRR